MVGSLRASSAKNLHNPGKLAQGTEEQRSWVSEEGTQIDVGYGQLHILMAIRAMNYEAKIIVSGHLTMVRKTTEQR